MKKKLTIASASTKDNSFELEKISQQSLILLNNIDYLKYRSDKNNAIISHLENISFKIENYPDIDKNIATGFDEKINEGEHYINIAIEKLKRAHTF